MSPGRTIRRLTASPVCVTVALMACPALADGSVPFDEAKIEGATARTVDRPWLYSDDAKVAQPLQSVGISRLTYTGVAASPTRPFASNVGTAGAMGEAGGEVGLLPKVSLEVLGVMAVAGSSANVAAGATAGLRVSLLPAAWRSTHATLSAGYLRELSDGNGAWLRAAFAQDIDRTHIAVSAHAEHVFAAGRDALDVMVAAGVSYRVLGDLRFGAEYVGQDVEETFGDTAEGGVRHFLGPVVSLHLLHDRLSLVAGPSVGLSYLSPKVLGRFGLAYAF